MSDNVLWIILAVGNVPVYLLIGKVFFTNWERFFYAVKFWFKPDIMSWFDGTYWEDHWCELVLFLFFLLCGLVVYGEHFLVTALIFKPF